MSASGFSPDLASVFPFCTLPVLSIHNQAINHPVNQSIAAVKIIMATLSVRAPATTANLGPGYDCLGMALDLWNRLTVSTETAAPAVRVRGEGARRTGGRHGKPHLPGDAVSV